MVNRWGLLFLIKSFFLSHHPKSINFIYRNWVLFAQTYLFFWSFSFWQFRFWELRVSNHAPKIYGLCLAVVAHSLLWSACKALSMKSCFIMLFYFTILIGHESWLVVTHVKFWEYELPNTYVLLLFVCENCMERNLQKIRVMLLVSHISELV